MMKFPKNNPVMFLKPPTRNDDMLSHWLNPNVGAVPMFWTMDQSRPQRRRKSFETPFVAFKPWDHECFLSKKATPNTCVYIYKYILS